MYSRSEGPLDDIEGQVSEAACFLIGPDTSWLLRSLPESRVANRLPIPSRGPSSERTTSAQATLPECKKRLARERDPKRQVDRRHEIRGPHRRTGGARRVEIVREVEGGSTDESQSYKTHHSRRDHAHRSSFGGREASAQKSDRHEKRRHERRTAEHDVVTCAGARVGADIVGEGRDSPANRDRHVREHDPLQSLLVRPGFLIHVVTPPEVFPRSSRACRNSGAQLRQGLIIPSADVLAGPPTPELLDAPPRDPRF